MLMLHRIRDGIRPLARPLAIYAASRVLVVAVVAVSEGIRGGDGLISALTTWDGNWYISAASGYSSEPIEGVSAPQSNIAFLPVLPLSIRATSIVTGLSLRLSAILVVHIYGAAATVLMWILLRRLAGEDVATRSIALFWFFPGSAVLSMAYAETAMLTFAAACLYALLIGRWWVAGATAALASATRPTGIVLAVCCLWQAIHVARDRAEWRGFLSVLLAPMGLAAYFLYLWALTGHPDAWIVAQRAGWRAELDFGRGTVQQLIGVLRDPLSLNTALLLQMIGIGLVILGGVFLSRWRPPAPLVVYTVGVLAVALVSSTPSAGGARPRFVLMAFPLIASIAREVRGRLFYALVLVSGLSMAAAAVVYTTEWWVIP